MKENGLDDIVIQGVLVLSGADMVITHLHATARRITDKRYGERRVSPCLLFLVKEL